MVPFDRCFNILLPVRLSFGDLLQTSHKHKSYVSTMMEIHRHRANYNGDSRDRTKYQCCGIPRETIRPQSKTTVFGAQISTLQTRPEATNVSQMNWLIVQNEMRMSHIQRPVF
jgi:hypothetical protein